MSGYIIHENGMISIDMETSGTLMDQSINVFVAKYFMDKCIKCGTAKVRMVNADEYAIDRKCWSCV